MTDFPRKQLISQRCLLVVALGLAVINTSIPVHAATATGLEARVATLESELQELKAQLAQMRASDAAAAKPAASAAAAANPAGAATADGASSALPAGATEARPALTWFGYGELNYTRPSEDPSAARADLGRFVIGTGYRFDERTRLESELEIEHAVSSAGDPGEVAIEQAYIEHELNGAARVRAGLFLIPSGLLNENHEPTRYYGVFRNIVETEIIPSTWREGGVGFQGNTTRGLRWDAGVTTGFNLSKWDPASSAGTQSPLGSIHQELALARAAQPSAYLAANYTGIPGLRLGASVFGGGASQRQPGMPGSRVLLWEGHARWQPGAWDLAALYARGHISGTAALNAALAAQLDDATLVPEDFYGAYLEAAWRGRVGRSWPLIPFARVERFNTGSGYAASGSGTPPPARADQTAYTAGVQLEFAPGVVFKTDYVDVSGGSAGDRFDLGLGYAF
ncbi:MAG: hypothetical protein KGJ52_02195 [Gammaproteobacteria bacterium]|nr:hypothetical protein [Gammaproteobacteria bacterium]